MSVPPRVMLAFSPSEIEFLAENELIEIEPLSSLPRICLLQNDYGPFDPLRLAVVPLWLALVLKERDLCLIKPPRWMRTDFLSEKCREECANEVFSDLPLHYIEIAARLLHVNKECDIPDAALIKTLLQDLREVRLAKARKGVEYIDNSHIRVDNMSLMEINEIRPSFCNAFLTLKKIQLARSETTFPGVISENNISSSSTFPNSSNQLESDFSNQRNSASNTTDNQVSSLFFGQKGNGGNSKF